MAQQPQQHRCHGATQAMTGQNDAVARLAMGGLMGFEWDFNRILMINDQSWDLKIRLMGF